MTLSTKKELFSQKIQTAEVTKLSLMEAAFKAANSFSGSFKLPSVSASQSPRRPSTRTPAAQPVYSAIRPTARPVVKPPEEPEDSGLNLRRKTY